MALCLGERKYALSLAAVIWNAIRSDEVVHNVVAFSSRKKVDLGKYGTLRVPLKNHCSLDEWLRPLRIEEHSDELAFGLEKSNRTNFNVDVPRSLKPPQKLIGLMPLKRSIKGGNSSALV
ncbi:hypothetical protein BU23DRAFT_569018 [Bimuria novae-zelandiae CBS 107.79]|uniref:Uncharacterized protein n=1 Tax=Bimuria novae-zelandiae CBS 107.79 TaxID=1447943 RepID=A0A6A5V880_9PLEO|nr:hypothetical protein BU23DRAFT_569018 [Bimuria novae-zelandiae CBS 107.79]